jgi:hypothetical protein
MHLRRGGCIDSYVDFREHRVLRASFWIKLSFIIIEVALAIGKPPERQRSAIC